MGFMIEGCCGDSSDSILATKLPTSTGSNSRHLLLLLLARLPPLLVHRLGKFPLVLREFVELGFEEELLLVGYRSVRYRGLVL
jgi:hypothetical protein